MPQTDIGIGGRLRSARARTGWSREALAFHSGISWSAIAQIEAGRRRNLRPSTLSALAGALGVTIDYLVDGRSATSPMLEHRALLYENDSEFMAVVAPFLAEAVDRSEATLAVTTAAKIELVREALGPRADGIEFAESASWYRDATSALGGYRTFLHTRLDAGAPWVRILGEPVWTGRSTSEIRFWERYESLLNLVFSAEPVTVLCPYDMRTADPEIARRACVTHPHAIGCDKLGASPEYVDPSVFVLGS